MDFQAANSTNTTSCTLLSSGFDYFVQILLACVSFLSLIVKRYVEKPRRKWKIFFFDTSKQIAGMAVAHVGNIVFSFIFSVHGENPCAWYLINLILDTIFRTLFSYLLLLSVEAVARRTGKTVVYKTGDYGEPIDYRRWLIQLFIWVALVLVARSVLSLLMYPVQDQLYTAAEVVLSPFNHVPNNGKVELIVVMVIVPLILNSTQFVVQDTFLSFSYPCVAPCCAQSVLLPSYR
mmetsp:Transcript_49882/g.128357  ORF Transcript_49882/g.128357 Transcript_49882/m.128357 type:complete len:234 (+) Transcript_49882:202-903(+)